MGKSLCSMRAVCDGTWILTVTGVNTILAGKDHELPVSWVHVDGPTVAVAPPGIPVKVKVAGVGKLVPLVGAMSSVYVAVPPGITVCDAPLPLLMVGVLTVKSNCHAAVKSRNNAHLLSIRFRDLTAYSLH